MAERHVHYLNSRGRRINGILETPESKNRSGEVTKGRESRFPAVALAPHFTGFKELKHLHKIAEALSEQGIASLRFDYADCINLPHKDGICNDITLSGYVTDLIATLDFLDRQPEVDSSKLGVLGHSIGGATAILAASKDSRVKAVVPIAPLAKGAWEPLLVKNAKKWEKQGYLTFNTPKRGEIKIGFRYCQDLKNYDGTVSVKDISAPFMIIHGTKDELIPLKQSEALFKNAKQPKKFEKILGADHLFTNEKHEKKMIDLCTGWFKKHLQ